MSIVGFAYLFIFILILVVLLVLGRILFSFFPGAHATKLNAFLFVMGVLAGAFILDLLAFVSVAALKTSLNRQAEDRLGALSLLVGAVLGGTAVLWLRVRKSNEPKQGRPT